MSRGCDQIFFSKDDVKIGIRYMKRHSTSLIIRGKISKSQCNTTSHLLSFFGCCSVTQLCMTLCNPTDCSTPSFSILHRLPALAQTHIYWIDDAIQSSHPSNSHSNKCWQGCGDKIHLCTAGRNVNWYSHYGQWYGDSSW